MSWAARARRILGAASRTAPPPDGTAAGGTAPGARLGLADLARYDRLALRVVHGGGTRTGERRFPGTPQPSGIETESFTAYTPGDDLRHLDWNAFGRLDSLLVRRFTAEREVTIDLLVDVSASMGAPPTDDKRGRARDLALVLGYLALGANDALRLVALDGREHGPAAPVLRQRRSVPRLVERLDALPGGGTLALGAALAAHAHRHPSSGVALVVSDFLTDPDELAGGLQALRARGCEVSLLHVLGASEREPRRLFARGILADVESASTRPVVLTAAAAAAYQAALASHLAALAGVAVVAAARYARLEPDASVADFVTGALARTGLVCRR